jgi:hypothetical protein
MEKESDNESFNIIEDCKEHYISETKYFFIGYVIVHKNGIHSLGI